MARRSGGAPATIAYWLTSANSAAAAASLSSVGAGKSGKPWARLTAPAWTARRFISRMTDSVKLSALRLMRRMAGSLAGHPRRGVSGPGQSLLDIHVVTGRSQLEPAIVVLGAE